MPQNEEIDAGQLSFAEEIRASERLFIDTAVKLFRERMVMEYPRLRGYAVESGTDRISLEVHMAFSFSPLLRAVDVECVTLPRFRPAAGMSRKSVPLPKRHAT